MRSSILPTTLFFAFLLTIASSFAQWRIAASQENPAEEAAEAAEAAPAIDPRKHLTVPSHLSDSARRKLETALDEYRDAFRSKRERHKLFKSAIRKLETAARDSEAGGTAIGHFYLGSAYNQLRNAAKALPPLQRAVELAPDFFQAHTLLAEVLMVEGRVTEALNHFDRALEQRSSYRRAVLGKAKALVRAGKYKEAHEFTEKALEKIFLEEEEDDEGGRTRRSSSSRNPDEIEGRDYLIALLFSLEEELEGKGWKEEFVHESENYRVETSVSQEFAAEIAKHAELIRRAYMVVFPDIKRPERKYVIVVHANKTAYHKAGGPPFSGGYYTPLLQKLVFYKYPKLEDTLLVLNHEAFHQFLHEYLEIAPTWFNEGLGDYFGPFQYQVINRKEYMVPQANPWRLDDIQYAIRAEMAPTPAELMLMSKEEMYDPQMAGVHYAMSWSLVYFMLHGGRDHGYDQLLVRYFQSLRLGRGIDGAYDDSFGRIDMKKFEEHWKTFVLTKIERPKSR